MAASQRQVVVPTAIDQISETLGGINATMRLLKERLDESARDQNRREDKLHSDLREIQVQQRSIESNVAKLAQNWRRSRTV
jgi:uncharacterized protein YhaN